MFTTLAAVLVALALGHVAPAAAASLRRFDGFRRWLGWLDAHGGKAWQGPAGVALALLPPLLLMALLAWLLRGVLFGLPSLMLGVAVLAWCWGPRDLDRDIEAIIDADDAATRQAAVRNLQSAGGSLREDVPSLVEATVLNALRRWFAVLFWFLLLGPAGALGYRLLALMAESPMRARVPVEPLALAQRLLGWIEWPVAQLMAFSMALVGNFDTAWKAWRQAHGERLPPPGVYDRIVQEVERPLISICLAATRGNQIQAAHLLGLNRNTLRKKIRELGLEVIRGLRNE